MLAVKYQFVVCIFSSIISMCLFVWINAFVYIYRNFYRSQRLQRECDYGRAVDVIFTSGILQLEIEWIKKMKVKINSNLLGHELNDVVLLNLALYFLFIRCNELFESTEAMMHHVTRYHAKGIKRRFSCHLCKKHPKLNKIFNGTWMRYTLAWNVPRWHLMAKEPTKATHKCHSHQEDYVQIHKLSWWILPERVSDQTQGQ